MATRPEQLYKDDFYAWTRDQAQALRRLAEQRWNGPLDLEHLADEVDELGIQARNAVRSQLLRILEHALKLEHSPAADPRVGWLNSIDDARGEIEAALTPAIRAEVEPMLPKLFDRARRKVIRDLTAHGEKDAARALPADCPYAFDDLIDDDWWPVNRHGVRDDD
jgi:Domain of unknown function DUF29